MTRMTIGTMLAALGHLACMRPVFDGSGAGSPGGAMYSQDAALGPSTDVHDQVAPGQDAPAADPMNATAGTCESVPGEQRPAADAHELVSLLGGKWRLCSGRLPARFQGDGLEFRVTGFDPEPKEYTGMWYVLRNGGSGTLERAAGFDTAGRLTILESQQTNLHLGPDSFTFVRPAFTDSPRWMKLMIDITSDVGTYVPAP
jgi:hypothetical protein